MPCDEAGAAARLSNARDGFDSRTGRSIPAVAERRGACLICRSEAGSTPAGWTGTATVDPVVQRRRRLGDIQETMVRLHPGSLTVWRCCWPHAAVVGRK